MARELKDDNCGFKAPPSVKARYQEAADAMFDGNLSLWIRKTLDAEIKRLEASGAISKAGKK